MKTTRNALEVQKLIGFQDGAWSVFDVRFIGGLSARDIAELVNNKFLNTTTAQIVNGTEKELRDFGNGLEVAANPIKV